MFAIGLALYIYGFGHGFSSSKNKYVYVELELAKYNAYCGVLGFVGISARRSIRTGNFGCANRCFQVCYVDHKNFKLG